jgi:RNA polymerase sigma-70 factor (ECF subfamily)
MPAPQSHPTLLLQFRDAENREVWHGFVRDYGPPVYAWCQACRLSEADAAAVTEEVLVRLARALRSYQFDPALGTFRSWMTAVAERVLRDLEHEWGRPERKGTGVLLKRVPGPDDLAGLATALAAEAKREVLREAEIRVQQRVVPRLWRAYQATALEGKRAVDMAAELQMQIGEVYAARARIVRMLNEEVRRLSGDMAADHW